ncbi:MAG: hypothetical protein R6U02_04400 [Alkalibacterium sp.]|uniref:hypothetical protein n=1 Tax=Alkalibacterium sp. TaxID=1872447 RepID=UPI003970644C
MIAGKAQESQFWCKYRFIFELSTFFTMFFNESPYSLENSVFKRMIVYRLKKGSVKMKNKVLFIIVLNHIDLLDDLLMSFNDEVGQAATVIDSVGMAEHLSQLSEARIFSTIKPLFISSHTENKTIYSVIPEEDLDLARQTVRKVLKDIGEPNTGIMFAVPVLFQEGIRE